MVIGKTHALGDDYPFCLCGKMFGRKLNAIETSWEALPIERNLIENCVCVYIYIYL